MAGTTGIKQGFLGAIRILTIAVCIAKLVFWVNVIKTVVFLNFTRLCRFFIGDYCGRCCA